MIFEIRYWKRVDHPIYKKAWIICTDSITYEDIDDIDKAADKFVRDNLNKEIFVEIISINKNIIPKADISGAAVILIWNNISNSIDGIDKTKFPIFIKTGTAIKFFRGVRLDVDKEYLQDLLSHGIKTIRIDYPLSEKEN